MLALSQDMAQNRPVEAKSHVQRFHELFFTLSPDKDAIESNVRRSLFLADKSAYNYYKDLSEKGSDNNPHGFIMEAFTITENKDLRTIKR